MCKADVHNSMSHLLVNRSSECSVYQVDVKPTIGWQSLSFNGLLCNGILQKMET